MRRGLVTADHTQEVDLLKSFRSACVLIATYFGLLSPQPALAQATTSRIAFNIGLDASHAYLFRGIKQERQGAIIQPYADVTFRVFEEGGGLNFVALTLGQWNSLHSGPSGADGAWYEADFLVGATLGVDQWEAGVSYTSYVSPNGMFDTVQELGFSVTMPLALSPHVGMAIEMSGQADGGDSEGVYLELGAEPGLDISDGTILLNFPAVVGLSLNNYYENGNEFNDTFGYFALGTVAMIPLNVSESAGSWGVSVGVHLIALGNYLEVLNDNDQFQVVGSIGFSLGF